MKAETVKSAEYVEMAKRTTANAMEVEEENMTLDIFFCILQSFEKDMQFCHNKIKVVSQQAKSLNQIYDVLEKFDNVMEQKKDHLK